MNPNLKFQMKNKVYVFHTDPGHGWLAVKKRELNALGVTGISHHSYVKGNTVYLEEDCDAPKFINAYKAKYGHEPFFAYRHTEKRSHIRSYDRNM